MASEGYNEEKVVGRLKKAGVQFTGGKVMTIKGVLGIRMLGMVDYLVNHCDYFAKFQTT